MNINTYFPSGGVSPEMLAEIEAICSEFISSPRDVFSQEVPLKKAKDIHNLRAVFGEVYPDPVRVVSVGKPVDELLAADNSAYAIEFCGGTHLSNTAQAQEFALVSEEGIAKGVRRIVAVTGEDAKKAAEEADELEKRLDDALALPPSEIGNLGSELKIAIDQSIISASRKFSLRKKQETLIRMVLEEQKRVAAENKAKAVEITLAAADEAANANKKFLVMKVPDIGLDSKALQEAANKIQKKHPSMAVMFFAQGPDKGLAFAAVPKDMSTDLPAGAWVKDALETMGGKGGGKPTSAQGMGPNVDAIPDAMDVAEKFASTKL